MVFVFMIMTHAHQARLNVICVAWKSQINAAAGKNYEMHVWLTPMEYKRIFHDKWKTRILPGKSELPINEPVNWH